MSKPILFIACTHGDEPIGKAAVEALSLDMRAQDHFDSIVGNPRALSLGKRFTDADLNRSAPGKFFSTAYEVRRARAIISKARSYPFVVDLHQTRANDRIVIIITRLSPANLAFALKFNIDTILFWPSPDPEPRFGPLVSFVPVGIEIESGTKTDFESTREKLTILLREFLAAQTGSVTDPLIPDESVLASRAVFFVGETIQQTDLPNGPPVDFQLYQNGAGSFYPLLFGRHAGLIGYKMRRIDTVEAMRLSSAQEN